MRQGHLAVERTTGEHGSTMTGNQASTCPGTSQSDRRKYCCGDNSTYMGTSLDAEEDPCPL